MLAVKDSTERQAAGSLAHQIISGRPSKPARRELARQNGSASCFFLVSNRTPNSVGLKDSTGVGASGITLGAGISSGTR